nr:DoxX-like family protein [Granulicella aggregans]
MSWATAWSFDRLRLWAETGQTPESTLRLSLIHGVARISLAAIWFWHGLVPKLLFHHVDEQAMLVQAGLSIRLLPSLGVLEIVFALIILGSWRWRYIFPINILIMVLATFAVAHYSPEYIRAAFNPVTLNLSVISLSLAGWLSSPMLALASRCGRKPAKEQP